jgi:uncharacterized Zn finger protein
MDTGSGEFKKISDIEFEDQMENPKPMVFKVGEILDIRSSRFRVEKIQRKKMILKLLPQLGNYE